MLLLKRGEFLITENLTLLLATSSFLNSIILLTLSLSKLKIAAIVIACCVMYTVAVVSLKECIYTYHETVRFSCCC